MFTSKLPSHCIDKIVLKLIISMFLILLVPAALGASPNDACFSDTCHSTYGPTIDRTLYDVNPHKIIQCIACHEPSIDPVNDGNHGHFIQQLNGSIVPGPGSNIGGPLTTQYSSQSFALCYACHNETKLIGVLPAWPNNIPDDYHNSPPKIVNSIGTNFININNTGKLNDIYWPANIHWDHLDAFGVMSVGKFDYNKSGSRNSFQTCPTCHNAHGTYYPKMTKNDMAITYGKDSNGSFGYTGSLYFTNSSGDDLYCDGICHSSIEKYYRDEINLFEDCVSCHIYNVDNIYNISLVNRTAFSQGVHLNINRSTGDGIIDNNDCWTCHFNKDMNRSNISRCENCHTGSGSSFAPTAPKIRTHLPAVTNYSCNECHSKVINDPGSGIVNVTSHYLNRPQILSVNYCDYCHGPNPSSPFNATNKTIPEFKHDDPAWNGNATCRTCHTNSSVSADPNATETSSFHNLTTELGDAYNGTQVPGTGVKADCIICHIQKSAQFVTAPDLPLAHPSLSGTGIGECYGCHGSGPGSQPQKLHSVEPSGGGCIGCHSNNATTWFVNTSLFGLHKNVNTSDGIDNVTDADCKTCHFASFPMVLGAANSSNTHYCDFCHPRSLSHGPGIDCKWCHAADNQPDYRYHLSGGPLGTAAGKNCGSCHLSSNLPDRPFHAPGISHSVTDTSGQSCGPPDGCHQQADNHQVEYKSSSFRPSISGLSIITTPVKAGDPAQVQATVTDSFLQIAAAQYRVTTLSGSVVINWTNMTPQDGGFNYYREIVIADIDTLLLTPGIYTVNVQGMASAPRVSDPPRTDPSKPYYPLNGRWSLVQSTSLNVTESTGYGNGTVYGTLGNIVGARVSANNTGVFAITNNTGFYSLSLPNGTYQLIASKEPEYYTNSSVYVTVTARTTVNTSIFLNLKPKGNISGMVTN